MNRIEIEVLSSHAALAAFSRAWRQTRAGRKTTPRLAFGSIAELFSAVSEKRLELVRHVAGDEGPQIRPLARALARDYKNVHTDVQALDVARANGPTPQGSAGGWLDGVSTKL